MEARLAWKEPGLFFVLRFAFLMATAVHLPLHLVLMEEKQKAIGVCRLRPSLIRAHPLITLLCVPLSFGGRRYS